MGLACSKAIACELGGDVTVKQSQKSLTIFEFSLPVKVEETKEEEDINYMFYKPDSTVESKAFANSNLLLKYLMKK